MAKKYKIRRPILAMSRVTTLDGITVGEGATSISRMYFGKAVDILSLSTGAASVFTASFLAPSAAITDKIFIMAGSAPPGVVIGGASCIVAGRIKVYCYNQLGSTSEADSPLSFAWLAVG